MSAQDHFKAGRLAEAVEAQTQAVKKSPTDADARFELFVLLCFAGEIERAEKQLDVIGTQDPSLLGSTAVFRNLLAGELERRRVFEESGRPVLPPQPPGWVEPRLEALERLRAGDDAAAARCLDRAIEASGAVHGEIDGQAFDGLCDFDDLLGGTLEVFAGGRYLWIPLEHVRRLELEEPATALDTLWRPARIEDVRDEEASVHLPVTYAGSHLHDDDAVRLARATDWQERGALSLGRGQHVWLSSQGDETREHPLLSLRRLTVNGSSGA